MPNRLDEAALKQLFLDARTLRAWQPRDVPDSVLKEIVDLMKMAPTANNSLPARIVFVKSKAAKERLKPSPERGQRRQDHGGAGHRHRRLRPEILCASAQGDRTLEGVRRQAGPGAHGRLSQRLAAGGYFILAARALGLDCGPMSGFDNAGVDKEFFAGTDTKSNFLCNLGYGDAAGLRPRGPRFAFDEMAKIL